MSDKLELLEAALVRAAKTALETLAAYLATAQVLSDIDFATALSATVLATVLSLIWSLIGGLPEVDSGTEDETEGDE